MPREEMEFVLSYYNSMTTWIDIDKLLAAFALTRSDLLNDEKVTQAIRNLAAKMPTRRIVASESGAGARTRRNRTLAMVGARIWVVVRAAFR